MKNIEEILEQDPVYLNDWKHKVDVIGNFEDIYLTYEQYMAEEAPYPNAAYWREKKEAMTRAIKRWENIHILFASYGQANYSGAAWVLFRQNGKLYEVNGSHCSCYGLENQWEPEEVLLEELEHRLLTGTFGEDSWSDNNFKQEICEFLGVEYQLNAKNDLDW